MTIEGDIEGERNRVVVVHHHIFKNAGTSFNHALKLAFGERFSEYDLPGGQVVTAEQLAGYIREHIETRAISGHHIALSTVPGVDDQTVNRQNTDGQKVNNQNANGQSAQEPNYQTISSVLIRNPLARVSSIYKFERQQDAQTEGARMAKRLSFKDFVAWRLETAPSVFCNYQPLYCSRTNNLQGRYSPTRKDLEVAIANLDRCFAVGTVERYDDFIQMAQAKLSAFYPQIVLQNAHLNVTSDAQSKGPMAEKRLSLEAPSIEETLVRSLGSELVAQLQQQNQLDQQLHAFANQILDHWLSQAEEPAASLKPLLL